MRRTLNSLILVVGAVICVSLSAFAQSATASLAEQLKAQYKAAVAGGDAVNGYQIVQQGTVLVIQKSGIVGFPPGDETVVPVKYQAGKLHGANGFLMTFKANRQNFSVGEKVYSFGVEVDLNKDTVTMGILSCQTLFKNSVVFQFAKGTLQKMTVPEVMDTIGEVLAFDQAVETAQQQQPQAQETPQQGPPAQPQSIQIGQTMDEVLAALGPPEKKVDLGTKQIFVYKDLKVTFKDGKVSDAE